MSAAKALDGTLRRTGRDRWEWRDGTPEPRVRDLSPSRDWNLRCRTDGDGTYVEVLAGFAREHPQLAWVLDGARAGRYRSAASGDHTGPLDLATGCRLHIRPGNDPLRGDPADSDPLPGPIPTVLLVPIDEWDAWAADHPLGVEWDIADEPSILDRARALGWTPHA